jgi:riboflavin transporter FmnP
VNNPSPLRTEESRVRWLTFSALFLALALVLPVAFHSVSMGGRTLLPMHLPVMLAGFLIGPGSGVLVGLLAPILSHIMTGMPPSYAVPLMALELPIYGLTAGIAYRKLRVNIYVSLIVAMIAGRLMFGLGLFVLGMFMELPYTAAYFFSAAGPIVTGLPGIVLQLVLVPILVTAVKRRAAAP